jgi:AAA+ ATPase superfamily predicted ATPase
MNSVSKKLLPLQKKCMQTGRKINPFLTQGFASPALFCGRQREVQELYDNLQNGMDTALVAPRGVGKTGLILHFFDFLSKKTDIESIYVDIYTARSLNEFIKLLAEATLRKFPEKTSVGKQFLQLLTGLRPLISYDEISDEPQVQIAYQSAQEKEYALQLLLQFLDGRSTPVALAIDEFQQAAQFPETNVEALLRACTQQLKNVRFIFCGSRGNVMTDLFSNATRPFFSSARHLALEKIEPSVYGAFIQKLFAKNGVNIEPQAVEFILSWTKCHTFFTQSLCNMTYQMAGNSVTVSRVKAACVELLKCSEAAFFQYRQLLTSAQWNFLIAVAKEGEVHQLTAKNFINRYGIGSPTDARRISKSLIDKELLLENVTKEATSYQVYDLFLSRWLERGIATHYEG